MRYGKTPKGPIETKDQMVYVLSIPGGYFKVGRAKNLQSRITNLQCGCPEPITVVGATQISENGIDANAMERRVQYYLSEYRSSGEWFRVPQDYLYFAWKVAWTSFVKPEAVARLDRMQARRRLPENSGWSMGLIL